MRTPDPRFDLGCGEWCQPTSAPLPRLSITRYRHVCPDGTRVRVSGQYVPLTKTTLYRWTVGGEYAAPTSAPGPAGEPDWSIVDGEHALFPPSGPEEIEPDCYVCQDAGCRYCGAGENPDPGWEGAPGADPSISGPAVARVPAGIDQADAPAAHDALPF